MNNRRRTIFRYENKTYAHLNRVIPKGDSVIFLRTLHKNDIINGFIIYEHMLNKAEIIWKYANIEFSRCIGIDDYVYPFGLFLVKKQDVREKRKKNKNVRKQRFSKHRERRNVFK